MIQWWRQPPISTAAGAASGFRSLTAGLPITNHLRVVCAYFSVRCHLPSIRYIEGLRIIASAGKGVKVSAVYTFETPYPPQSARVYLERPEAGKGYACGRPRTRYFLTSNAAAAAPWRSWRPAWDWRV